MLNTRTPTESELMAIARATLRKRAERFGPMPAMNPVTIAPATADPARRKRSITTCHRPSMAERPRKPPAIESGAFVPATAARIENDPNLTDGARRCARKLMEETYRRNRSGRSVEITVSYIGKALGRCRRTVQRYLRQLEQEGYVEIDVIAGQRSRLCIGLVVRLLAPVFPRHHREKWPERPANPDATQESQNKRFIDNSGQKRELVSRPAWAVRCMDGVFRALMKTIPPVSSSGMLSG